jgi:hypothetical protein
VISKIWKKIQKKLEKLAKFGLGKEKKSQKIPSFLSKDNKITEIPQS